MNHFKRIAVVGGGIGGLSAALELSKSPDVRVTLFEKERRTGGLCSSYSWKDVVCDRFYHVVLSSDSETLRLGRELGIEDSLAWKESRSGFFGRGRLVSMSSAFDFLRFPFLNPWEKMRLGLGILEAVRLKDPLSLENTTAPDWLKRIFGRRVYERIWDPLLRSKLGEGRFRTSATFIHATINRLYGAREGGRKKETMGGYGAGIWTLVEAAEKELRKRGVEIRTAATVAGLRWNPDDSLIPAAVPEEHRFFLRTGEAEEEFDRVLLTVPDPVIDTLLPPDFSHPFRERLKTSEQLGIICVLFILRRSLSPFYVINLLDTDLPFTGVIETTRVYSQESYGGCSLVYLPRYVLPEDPANGLSDEEVEAGALEGLRRIRPDLKSGDILHAAVFRAPFTQVLPTPETADAGDGFETPVPGLFVSNSGLIRSATLNNNAVLTNVRRVVPLLLQP